MDVEAALVSGAMPADIHSILLSTAYQKRHTDMDVGATALFAPDELFREIHPEIESFDYSWSIVNDSGKAEFVESSYAG